ncbi:DUF4926 domain-containing protein [Wukongibacter sp. M2B1]|uniref:DUF4926 domain-containing protein n=1 Tax=Wukongibacter sp. M2B1 TaxID=3088895 RepID=UPI003D7A2106
MLKEYDVVIASCDLSQSVKQGTRGTIVLIVHKEPNKYEVEFVDENGDMLELLTVDERDLKLVEE